MQTALVIAPHPDDAELAMGGTVIKMINAGYRVIIVDLTDGEPTPFGSRDIRAEETRKASVILGVTERFCLDLPNRSLEPTLQNRKKVAEMIRIHQPDILFAPAMPDWHPDHKAALELAEEARFEAKYHKTSLKGNPHWTSKLWQYYSPHRQSLPSPSIIVDISDIWKKKFSAIQSYQSQLNNKGAIHCYPLLERIEIAAKYYGQCIGVKYGEPFVSPSPLALSSCSLSTFFRIT